MSDFDDLRQIREAKEDAEAAARERAQDEQKQHANAQRRLREKLIADAQLFDAAVTDVLENLRKAVYTSARSSTFDYLEVRGSAGSWSIGMSDSQGYCSPVNVNLRYDDHGDRPLCFVVKRERVNIEDKWFYFEPVNCGLTREELIRTLKGLHPPHTIGAGLDYVTTYVGW